MARAVSLAVVLALLGGLDVSVAVVQTSVLHFDLAAAKERPVSKVISLLKEIQSQLEKDAAEDEEIYDKLVCWCETNSKDKTKSIGEAETRVADLTNKVEELTAESARLNTEIKNTQSEVTKNQQSLDQATALRQQQLAAFNAEEKDLLGSISALKAAIVVLSKHHGGAFLQVPQSHMLSVAVTLQHEMQKHAALLAGVLTHSERKLAMSFIQSPYASYAPQSGEIFGILKQMHETFESNLAASQKEEQANQKAYDDLKAAKESEIAAGQDQINTKTQELADTDAKLAQSKQDISDTNKSLGADQEFLAMLKERCQISDKEWDERTKTRNLETEAITKALAILSGDDTHDLFTRTFNPSLVQQTRVVRSHRRAQAASLLVSAASKFQNQELASLATMVRLDAFERVKKAIGDMVTQLLKEKEDEIKHKDFCIAEFNANEKHTEEADRQKHSLMATIEDLGDSIKMLTAALEQLKAEVVELQVQLKRAGENREKENREFQSTVADQRETQKVLAAARAVLAEFYSQTSLLQERRERQERQPAGPPPPEGFSEYKSNAGGKGVLDLLQQIIADAKSAEDETIRSEEDSQKAYEDFVKESNASIEAKNKDVINKSEVKAKTEADLVASTEAKQNKELELEQLSNYNAQLHQSCDFVLKNFDIRQSARDEEVEALRQATAILSGANFDALLQHK